MKKRFETLRLNKVAHIFIVTVIFTLQSCAHPLSRTGSEECASYNMKLYGMSVSHGTSVGMYNGKLMTGASHGTSANCVKPESKPDQCYIEAQLVASKMKDEFNSNVGTINFLIWVGYFAWIIPGVIGYNAYQSHAKSENDRINESVKKYLMMCESNKYAAGDILRAYEKDVAEEKMRKKQKGSMRAPASQ